MPPSNLNVSSDLPLPLDAVTSTLVVYGGKGMGKTNFLAVFAEELAAHGQRFSVMDPVGVSWGLQHGRAKGQPGLEVLILGGVHGDIPIEPAAGIVVADLVADESVSTVVDISRSAAGKMWSHAEKIRFVADYSTRLYERQGERRVPLMQIYDEAGRFVPQNIPRGAEDITRCIGAIEQLVELGRNVTVGVTLVTQRSARMSKSVSELADCMISFRTIGPLSSGAVLEWLGDHVEKTRHKLLMEQLRQLDVGQALVVSPGWLKFEGVVRMRARETFDSSKTLAPGKQAAAPGKATKPDLAQYRVRMAETIERAKLDDPKALRLELAAERKRTTERDAQIEKLKAAPAPTAKVEVKRVEVPLLRGKERQAVERTARELRQQAERTTRELSDIAERFEAALGDATTKLADIANRCGLAAESARDSIAQSGVDLAAKLDALLKTPATLDEAASKPAGTTLVVPRGVAVTISASGQTAKPTPARVDAGPGDQSLTPALRKVLTALAQYPDGRTKRQVGILTGYRADTGHFGNMLTSLRGAGYIVGGPDRLQATGDGVAALGSFDRLPEGDALRENWLRRLSPAEAKVLQGVCDAYPSTITKTDLGERTGYRADTGHFGNLLTKLRTLDLISGSRELRASEELFG